jgi:hypothetical protein
MSKADDRVLNRIGARLLTENEMNQVSGSLRTGNCTFDPKTCVMDNDCEPPLGC